MGHSRLAVPSARGPAAPVHPGPAVFPERRLRRAGRRRRLRPGRADRRGLHRADASRLALDRGRRHPGRLPHLQLPRDPPLRAPAVRRRGQGHPLGGPRRPLRRQPRLGPQPPRPRQRARLVHRPVDPPLDGHPAVRGLHLAARPQDRRRAGPGPHQRDRRRDRARRPAAPGRGRPGGQPRPGPAESRGSPAAPAAGRGPAAALPAPAALPALPAAAGGGDGDSEAGGDGEVTGTVVGFGLFDPFGEDRGNRR